MSKIKEGWYRISREVMTDVLFLVSRWWIRECASKERRLTWKGLSVEDRSRFSVVRQAGRELELCSDRLLKNDENGEELFRKAHLARS